MELPSPIRRIFVLLSFQLILACVLPEACPLWASDNNLRMGAAQRDQAEECVKKVEQILKDSYYDPSFHGMDLKARAAEAIDRIHRADTLSETYGIIAWMLEPLNDSHTFFLPPRRPYDIQNGWELGFIGDRCFITSVQSGSDADSQGVKPGDEVLSLEGYPVTRDNLWKLQYAFEALAPSSAIHFTLRSPNGEVRNLLVNAKVEKLSKVVDPFWSPEDYIRSKDYQRVLESRVIESTDGLAIWKLPEFGVDTDVDRCIRQVRKHDKLILDLRNNPGGVETVISRLLASVFDRDLQVGERLKRHDVKPWEIKTRGVNDIYSGKLVVLIDSRSASAAEIFARVVQIEKRGLVVGDRSSGKVMEARQAYISAGHYSPLFASMSVTVSDIRLRDGKSLENNPVVPDVIVLPTPDDLRAGRDPVLARAAAELGVSLTAEQAGKLLPNVWREH